MQKVNIEVEAFTFSELTKGGHLESMREMRRLFGKDTLEELSEYTIIRVEKYAKNILNTEIEVCIDVGPVGCFDVDVTVQQVGVDPVPRDSEHNVCPHVREAVKLVGDIQLFSKVLKTLEFNGEHLPAQGEMVDLIDIRTRELTYEIVQSVTAMFGEEMDQIHTEQWAEVMAVQGGLLFTKEGKVIVGAVNYNQVTSTATEF